MINQLLVLSKKELAIILCIISFGSLPVQAQETKYLAVESNHSTVLFSVPISNGITRITGKFTDYSIEIDYVNDDLSQSNMAVVIQATSIDTGIDGRDEHLRTKDFFEVDTYPEITFVSKSIVKTDVGYIANGDFTMHGVTKNMALPILKTGVDGNYTFGFSSRLSLLRSDYNIGSDFEHSSMENFIGDEISVEINFWTKKNKKKTSK